MASKFQGSVAKGLKLKVRKFWGLTPMLVEVTEKKLVGGAFCPQPPTPLLYCVNDVNFTLALPRNSDS